MSREERPVDVYRTEEEQVEALKRFWKENGKAIVGGLALGLALLFGWRSWQLYVANQEARASYAYQVMMSYRTGNKDGLAKAAAEKVVEDHPRSTYADLARLHLAWLANKEGKAEEAASRLREVMAKAGIDGVREIARIRLARLTLGGGQPDEALKLLEGLRSPVPLLLAEELRGDILLQKGRTDEARSAYARALELAKKNARAEVPLLSLKLEDLGPGTGGGDQG
ncbi:MAG: hypothetical protein D6786_05510 [Gammaproteobacteria bacterium]|nr:MAG: hypothetical protein D6786_05510 [Gammaproteobacteria bacterium]